VTFNAATSGCEFGEIVELTLALSTLTSRRQNVERRRVGAAVC
jgi:hypothetical protein